MKTPDGTRGGLDCTAKTIAIYWSAVVNPRPSGTASIARSLAVS
jgi:hypothetical protein